MKTSRRDFLKSFALGQIKKELSLRPPYAQDEKKLLDICPTCIDFPCVSVCETNVIELENNIPKLSFAKAGCSYCDKCAEICENEALNTQYKHKINAYFFIDISECLAYNGIICSTCKDVCDYNAIKFLGIFNPELKDENCIKCGFCVYPCPTKAIKFKEV